ncbi:MAG TPA: hypothetical protein VEX86_08765 [Longimicrobium sp.]|nr:hypothetical protein [Longimicrobium sp.]
MRKLAAVDQLEDDDSPSLPQKQPARAGAARAPRSGRDAAVDEATSVDAFAVLESLTGSIDAPADWAAEHDHYLYGTPKHGNQAE